jgi:formate dehydrogenase maturation protein FdhE
MRIDPQVAIAAVTTLGAGWLMMAAGVEKKALERRRRHRVCPSCGRKIAARVCASCAA